MQAPKELTLSVLKPLGEVFRQEASQHAGRRCEHRGGFGVSCFIRLCFILVGYAQTAAVGIVLLTGSPVYTELSGISFALKFDRKVDLFSSLFLAFRCQGRVRDLCITKHIAFEGSAAQF